MLSSQGIICACLCSGQLWGGARNNGEGGRRHDDDHARHFRCRPLRFEWNREYKRLLALVAVGGPGMTVLPGLNSRTT